MGAFRDFWDWLLKPFRDLSNRMVIDQIEAAQSVETLDLFWSQAEDEHKLNATISAAYTTRKAELTSEGLLNRKNRLLGYLGEQMANAVWAVTDANARADGTELDVSGTTGAMTLATDGDSDVIVVSNSTATEPTLVRAHPRAYGFGIT